MNMKQLRGTGRTTRMLDEAVRLDLAGRAVYVIAASYNDTERLKKQCGCAGNIKFETPESMGNFNWETLRYPGMHPNCVVLVDHHAIESRFSRIIEMLHRYDPEPQ